MTHDQILHVCTAGVQQGPMGMRVGRAVLPKGEGLALYQPCTRLVEGEPFPFRQYCPPHSHPHRALLHPCGAHVQDLIMCHLSCVISHVSSLMCHLSCAIVSRSRQQLLLGSWPWHRLRHYLSKAYMVKCDEMPMPITPSLRGAWRVVREISARHWPISNQLIN